MIFFAFYTKSTFLRNYVSREKSLHTSLHFPLTSNKVKRRTSGICFIIINVIFKKSLDLIVYLKAFSFTM